MGLFRILRATAAAVTLVAIAGCSATDARETPQTIVPVTKWDHRAQAAGWTEASLAALRSHGAPLVTLVPGDTETWCPGYPEASAEERKAFWIGLLSALAEHESTWNPTAVGGGGRWFGLVQISPATARGYGCEARTAEALKDGAANLSCAIRIMAETVPRDGVISAGGGGVAADWGPFHQSSKREKMRSWVSVQPYCRA